MFGSRYPPSPSQVPLSKFDLRRATHTCFKSWRSPSLKSKKDDAGKVPREQTAPDDTPPDAIGLSSDFIGHLSEPEVGITDTAALPFVQDMYDVIGCWKVKHFKARFKNKDASVRAGSANRGEWSLVKHLCCGWLMVVWG